MSRKRRPDGEGDAIDHTQGDVAPSQAVEEKQQPVQAVRLRNIRAAVWANRNDGGTYYTVTFSRSYRDQEGNWHTTESFERDALLHPAKAADVPHSWIWDQPQSTGPAETPF